MVFLFRFQLCAALLGLSLAGCLDSNVTFPVTQDLSFSSDDFDIPPAFLAAAEGQQVPEVPCQTADTCPQTSEVSVVCDDRNLCDPEPFEVTIAAEDIDLTEALDTRFVTIDTLTLRSAEYLVRSNTIATDLPALEVFWGPIDAADVSAPGVMRLGSIPSVPAETTPAGSLPLDDTGNAALTEHLASGERMFRVFLRASVDIDPGDMLPLGMLTATVQLRVTASGRLL